MAPDEKQQFNVYLDPELVRATKRACLDREQTLSDFVAEVLRAQLQAPRPAGRRATARRPDADADHVRPQHGGVAVVLPCPGIAASRPSRSGRWAELDAANGMIALHAAATEDEQRIALAFESHGPLALCPRAKRPHHPTERARHGRVHLTAHHTRLPALKRE